MATFTVLNLLDSGAGSLREAIDKANMTPNDADVINFAVGGTINLNSQLILGSDIFLEGDINGDGKADIQISGQNTTRIFEIVNSTTDVVLSSLQLLNGKGSGFNGGGAILANNANSLTLSQTTIANSSAAGSGGGIMAANTDTYIINSLIAGNRTENQGGGIYVSSAILTMVNTTVSSNSANNDGGGLISNFSTVNILNSTIADNRAAANINFGDAGGGVWAANSGSLTIANSVIARNFSGTAVTANDVSGTGTTTVNAGNSFFGSAVSFTSSTANQFGDPLLGVLADHGGAVLTYDPLDGSPLIDKGNSAYYVLIDPTDVNNNSNTTEVIQIDAAGRARILGIIDIGAVEHTLGVTLMGTSPLDDLFGTSGNDLFIVNNARSATGGAGNDIYNVINRTVQIIEIAGGGIDFVLFVGPSGTYVLPTHVENGRVGNAAGSQPSDEFGRAAADPRTNMTGNALVNIITGNNNNNILDGGGAKDRLEGRAGNDTYKVTGVVDTIVEGRNQGTDKVIFTTKNGKITLANNVENLDLGGRDRSDGKGNALDNKMKGNIGANVLDGQAGNDTLDGGNGRDTLIGGRGRDIMTGGGQADKFDFNHIRDTGITARARDVITDFRHGLDKIDLRDIDANGSAAGNGAFQFNSVTALSGVRGDLVITLVNAAGAKNDKTIISGDIDGDRHADFTIELTGLKSLSAADFIL